MKWMNTKRVIEENKLKEVPCKKCGYCPYGTIVEEFPLKHGEFACDVFGHDCPMYYNAEDLD